MYWYVLFVKTGREEKVEQLLKKRLDTDAFMPFIPMHETLFKISGKVKKELKSLFPGYLFIESEISGMEFVKSISRAICDLMDVFRFLKYGDTDQIAMNEHEKCMLLSLCNEDHCILSSSGIIVGNSVYIKEGPLAGLESIVRKIDRHKRRAIIDLEFMGSVREVSLALEIVEKM